MTGQAREEKEEEEGFMFIPMLCKYFYSSLFSSKQSELGEIIKLYCYLYLIGLV